MKGWPALVAGLTAFALYGRTLAPGLTWAHGGADGGDLLAAALTHGAPHPTGYPAYQLVLRTSIALYNGNPARAGAWLSALCMALAATVLADLCRRMLMDHESRTSARSMSSEVFATSEVSRRAGAAAAIAALAWAAAPAVWGQATITEVYALNALACVTLLWLIWRWAEPTASDHANHRYLWAAGLVLGLGMGNHLSLALILPGLLIWLWSKHLSDARFGRDVGLAALCALAGLLAYGYLPLAAAGRPPINWGDPVTPERFLWVVSGRLYAGLPFGLPLAELPARLLGWIGEAMWQFGGPWGLLLALLGLWRLDQEDRAWWRTSLFIALAFTIYGIGYNTTDSDVYLVPAWVAVALWLALAISYCIARLRGPAWRTAAAIVLLAALPGASLVRNWNTHDLSADREAEDFVAAAVHEAEPNSVIVSAGDRATFALWYGIYGLHRRDDVAVLNVNLYGFDWYNATFAETHPGVLPSSKESLEQLIPALAAQRPVYRADDLALALPGIVEERTGVLVRLRGAH